MKNQGNMGQKSIKNLKGKRGNGFISGRRAQSSYRIKKAPTKNMDKFFDQKASRLVTEEGKIFTHNQRITKNLESSVQVYPYRPISSKLYKKLNYSPTASSIFDTKEKRHW